MAGVALGDMDLHFAWQAWHLQHWAGSGGALGSGGRRGCLRGRRGTWRHRPSLCVAGVGLMALGWLWWRAWVWRAPRCLAGVALGDSDLHFAWQVWHLVTWTFTLCGRRGSYGTGLALVARLGLAGAAAVCVAGVALGDSDLQASQVRNWIEDKCAIIVYEMVACHSCF